MQGLQREREREREREIVCVCQRQRERGGGGRRRDMRIVKMDFDMKLGTENVNMGKGWASREPWLEL